MKKYLLLLLLLSACAETNCGQSAMYVTGPDDVTFYINEQKLSKGTTVFDQETSNALVRKLSTGSVIIAKKDSCLSVDCSFLIRYPDTIFKPSTPYFPANLGNIKSTGSIDIEKEQAILKQEYNQKSKSAN